jgi:excisionase family DNA binding protein
MEPTTPDLLSVCELQRRTGLSRPTLYAEIRSGRLPGVTLPGVAVVRVRRSDYEAWCETWVPTDGAAVRPYRRVKGASA